MFRENVFIPLLSFEKDFWIITHMSHIKKLYTVLTVHSLNLKNLIFYNNKTKIKKCGDH